MTFQSLPASPIWMDLTTWAVLTGSGPIQNHLGRKLFSHFVVGMLEWEGCCQGILPFLKKALCYEKLWCDLHDFEDLRTSRIF